MCRWTPTGSTSPDRVDALVWALHDLLIENTPTGKPLRLKLDW